MTFGHHKWLWVVGQEPASTAPRASIPVEWLRPGAVVPVTAETVRLLLDAVAGSAAPSQAPGGVSMRDVETLLDVAQHLRDVQDWRAQASVRLVAEVAKKLLPAVSAPACEGGSHG